MSWKYLEYQYASAQLIQKILIWISNVDAHIYFGFKGDTSSWAYYAGNGSHALATGSLLTNYATEAEAQTNYLSTSAYRETSGKVLMVLPSVYSAKYAKIFVESGSGVAVYEWINSTYFTAHEIITGELTITDQLSSAPLIKVTASTKDRIKIGKVGDYYGLYGYDGSGDKIFELSDNAQTIAGWTFTPRVLASSDYKMYIDSYYKTISINDTSFGYPGIQLQYNEGAPQAYIGNGSTAYIKYTTAGGVEIAGSITATTGHIGGFEIGATTISAPDTTPTIKLDSANTMISLQTHTFGSAGVQLQYASSKGKFYAGDGANKYFQWDGTNVSWKGVNTELTAAGAFSATAATITGEINANTGKIGGETNYWNITAGTITSVLAGSLVMGSVGSTLKLGAATDIDTGIGLFADGAGNIRVGSATSGSEYIKFASSVLTLKSSTFTLQASDSGSIGLTATAYGTGNGVWLSSTATSRFRVGNAGASRMQWDDVNLEIYNSSNAKIASFGGTNSIAGWDITTASLQTGAFDTNGTMYFGTSGISLSNTFKVTAAGSLTCTGATISGAITSDSGAIGGWNIVSGYIYNLQSGTPTSSPSDGIVLASGNEALTVYENTEKRVEVGYLSSGVYGLKVYDDNGSTVLFEASDTQKKFAGWTFTDSTLTSVSGANTTTLSSGATALIAGPTGSPTFTLTQEGVITATSGTIGGNSLSATTISSTSFHSGALGDGWQISNTGTAEFQNVTVRGKITTSVFEKGMISAINGMVIITSSDTLATDMTSLDASTITISGSTTFVANEVIRIKDGTDDEWMLVTNAASAPTYTVTRDLAAAYGSDSNPVWKKGTAVVSMGVGTGSKTGFILLDSSSSNSPYIDIYGRNSNTYDDYTLNVRLGWLKGIVDADVGLNSTDVWGLYSNSVYLKGKIVADTGYIGGTSGWVIAAGKITSTGIGLATAAGDATYAFWAGNDTPANAEFSVKHDGSLVASSATIVGDYKTSSTVGTGTQQGVHLDVTNNELYFYGLPYTGAAAVEKLASIGINGEVGDETVCVIGSENSGLPTSEYNALRLYSKNRSGLIVYTTSCDGDAAINATVEGRLTADASGGIISGLTIVSERAINGDGSYNLGYLYGGWINYGHNNQADINPTTDYAYGLKISPYAARGTITSMYDIYLDGTIGAGTVTHHYGIYQNAESTPNILSSYTLAKGGIRIGTTATDPGDNNFYVEGTSTFAGNITLADGVTLGQSAGPLLTFDDTNNYLEITGCSVLIGDTSNAKMTQGLTINQAGNDDEIISLKSSDVSHGMTDITEADTFGRFTKYSAASGGLLITGITDADVSGMLIRGYVGAASPVASAVQIMGSKQDSATIQKMGDAETVLQIKNYTTVLVNVLGIGDILPGTTDTQDLGSASYRWANTETTNLNVGGGTVETGSASTINIAIGTAPSEHVDDQVILYSADSSDSTATLALYLEQAVEDIGTFTASHKIKVFINGTAYWLQLDAV